jgi:uroporphyrinogen decarboxylase
MPHLQRAITQIRALGKPVTLYVKGSAHLLEIMAETGADTLSVDWTFPLSEVRRRVGDGVALQGNLDPTVMLSTPEAVHRATEAMLRDAAGDPRHIANLGHGILPTTPVECAKAFVDTVKGFRP